MRLSREMLEVKDKLIALGHEVILPHFTEEYAKLGHIDLMHSESVKNKVEYDLIKDYYKTISENDVILLVNNNLNGIDNYIGGNSFLEMGFAHVLNKKIYILNGLPNISFKDEIIAMHPTILNGDLAGIKNN